MLEDSSSQDCKSGPGLEIQPVDLGWEDREEAIELVNQFFRTINSLPLDGVFSIKPRAAAKFVDLYLKLSQTGRVYFRGIRIPRFAENMSSGGDFGKKSGEASGKGNNKSSGEENKGSYRKEKQELVSLLIARIEEKPFLQEKETVYIDIAVTKRGRKKKGYMSLLVKDVEKWAESLGIRSIELRAITANWEAMEFWRGRGYQEFYVRFRKLV